MNRLGPKPIKSLNLLLVIISKSNTIETRHYSPQVTCSTSGKARQPQNINRNGPKPSVCLKLLIVITSKSNTAETVNISPPRDHQHLWQCSPA